MISTPWGEVIEGGLAEGRGLALRTAVAELGDCGLGALLPLLRARSADDVEAAWQRWVEPVDNLVVADRDGAVRYRLAGRVPLRADANRRRLADPGDPGSQWRGWLTVPPADEVGPGGAIVTANERRGPESADVGAVFAPPYRHDRLWALLKGREDLTVADMAAWHDDALLDPRARLIDLTSGWSGWLERGDGRMGAGSAEAAVFAAWRSALVRRVAAEPVLDPLRVPAPSSVLAPFLDLTVRVGRALPGLAAVDRPLGIDLVAHAEAAREEVLASREAGTCPRPGARRTCWRRCTRSAPRHRGRPACRRCRWPVTPTAYAPAAPTRPSPTPAAGVRSRATRGTSRTSRRRAGRCRPGRTPTAAAPPPRPDRGVGGGAAAAGHHGLEPPERGRSRRRDLTGRGAPYGTRRPPRPAVRRPARRRRRRPPARGSRWSWNSTSSSSSPRSCSTEKTARAGTRNRSPAIWMRNDDPVSSASARRRSFATTSSVR